MNTNMEMNREYNAIKQTPYEQICAHYNNSVLINA